MENEISYPLYRCKEKVLMQTAIKAWQSYTLHIIEFKKFSPFYTEERAIHQLAVIKEVNDSYFTNENMVDLLNDELKAQCKLVCQKWQLLKRYIQGAYPKKFHAFKLKNAGKDLYFTAYRYKYEDMNLLIEQSIDFINNYKIILQLENNMPENFHPEYLSCCEKFKNLYGIYITKKQQNKQFKYEKIKALNNIYKPLMEMLNDAKAIFVNDKKTIQEFSFSKLYETNKD